MPRRIRSLLLIPILLVSAAFLLSDCSRSRSDFTVAIATLMTHPALDEVEEGLHEELALLGYEEGKNIDFIKRNANGQMQLVSLIANDLVALEPDLIIAITTPMAQAVVAVAKCPVVFSAVTDPVGAGIVGDMGVGQGNITGTSDAWPYKEQLELIQKMTPAVKTIGVVYNPGEAPALYGMRRIRELAPTMGFTILERTVSTALEVRPAAADLAGRVDALFLSSDNTAISGVAGAASIAIEYQIPLYVGDSGTVARGGLAAVSVGYRSLGQETARLVDRMLKGEKDIPTVIARGTDIVLNRKAAELMGIEIPEAIIARATTIHDEIER